MNIGALSPQSNRETFVRLFELTDADTGELLDLSDVDIVFEVANPVSGSAELSAEVGSGITVVSTGVFQVKFVRSDMINLDPQTYKVGCTISDDDETVQYFIGTLPVLDGVVGQ